MRELKLTFGAIGLGFAVLMAAAAIQVARNGYGSGKLEPLTRSEKISRMFSEWDGSFDPLVESVRSNLKSPESFEHVKTIYADQGDEIAVRMTYRATNGFGATVTESKAARYKLPERLQIKR